MSGKAEVRRELERRQMDSGVPGVRDVDKGKGRRVDGTVVRWMIGGIMDS